MDGNEHENQHQHGHGGAEDRWNEQHSMHGHGNGYGSNDNTLRLDVNVARPPILHPTINFTLSLSFLVLATSTSRSSLKAPRR